MRCVAGPIGDEIVSVCRIGISVVIKIQMGSWCLARNSQALMRDTILEGGIGLGYASMRLDSPLFQGTGLGVLHAVAMAVWVRTEQASMPRERPIREVCLQANCIRVDG